MKIKLIILLLLFGMTNFGFGQNTNMIIQVNNELVTFEISGMYLIFENEQNEIESHQIGYNPG